MGVDLRFLIQVKLQVEIPDELIQLVIPILDELPLLLHLVKPLSAVQDFLLSNRDQFLDLVQIQVLLVEEVLVCYLELSPVLLLLSVVELKADVIQSPIEELLLHLRQVLISSISLLTQW